MCGRYAARRDPAVLADEFDAVDETGAEAPGADHNVAPTKRVCSVVARETAGRGRAVRVMRWGLVPHWAKDRGIAAKMINARAETVAKKPAFRTALARRRCLLPADGWYEWRRADGRKQPYFMTPADGGGLAMAGIWSVWHDPAAGEDAPPLVTCAVITTAAVGRLVDIHDRMPLVLPGRAWAGWLDPRSTGFGEWLAPASEELVRGLELRPVSDRVNNVRNNGPELLERVDERGVPVDLDTARGQGTLFGPES